MPSERAVREAEAHLHEGRPEKALAVLRTALRGSPRDPELHYRVGLVEQRLGRHEAARYAFERAVELDGRRSDAAASASRAALVLRDHTGAESLARRALAIDPASRDAADVLAQCRLHADDLDGATAAYESLVARCALQPEAWGLLAAHHLAAGRPELAADTARRGIGRVGESPELLAQWCTAVNYVSGVEPSEVASLHARFGRAVQARVLSSGDAPTAAPEPGAPLRVAFLSPDLRTHSVATFLLPLIRALRERHADLDVGCVWTGTASSADARTAEIRGASAFWLDASATAVRDLSRRIRAEGVHVLIELSGLTNGHRMFSLIRRAAPVQATYLGYPNTTGLPTMDWRLVDGTTDPPGSEAFCTERLLRVDPCFLCFAPGPAERAAPVAARPPARPLTFASFNSEQKLSEACLASWAALLSETPGSRLVIKADLRLSAQRRRLISAFESRGVDASRVELRTHTPDRSAHLAMYADVDVALDTFPYNGTTTTCEALWMGVPVVTFAGAAHAGRVSASLLSAAGLRELVADDEPGMRALARGLIADAHRLATLRSALRDRLLASPLCDAGSFADRFAAAVREMWIRRSEPRA